MDYNILGLQISLILLLLGIFFLVQRTNKLERELGKTQKQIYELECNMQTYINSLDRINETLKQ